MDIQKEKEAYLKELIEREVLRHGEIDDIDFKPEISAFHSGYLSDRLIDNINFGWSAWQAAKAQVPEPKQSHSITLTCAQIREAFMFGAPDEDDQEQLETEMTIVWSEDGHSGKGYYCYYSELPEEGAIFLDEAIEAQEQKG